MSGLQRLVRHFIIFIAVASSLGCSETNPIFDTIFGIDAPEFSNGSTSIEVDFASLSANVTVTGEIDVRLETIELSFDDGATWENASAVVDVTLSDLSFEDGTFTLVFSPAAEFLTTFTVGMTQTALVRGKKGDNTSLSGEIKVTFTGVIPDIQFTAVPPLVNENSTLVLGLTLSAVPSSDVTVSVGFDSGTANMLNDFVFPVPAITIPSSNTSASITISINDDTVFEGNETLNLIITHQGGLVLGTNSIAAVSIVDLDTPPTVQFLSATDSTAENVVPSGIVVSISGASEPIQTVNYTVADVTAVNGNADYTLASGQVTFPSSSSSPANVTIPFQLNNDLVFEGNETFQVTLASVVGGATVGTPNVHLHTIIDNESAPIVQFPIVNTTLSEAVGSSTLAVSISNASTVAQTVSYTVADVSTESGDYTLSAGTLTFAALSTALQPIPVTIANDTSFEGNETFTISLSSISGGGTLGGMSVHTITIVDNDPIPAVGFSVSSASTNEASGPAQITVTLSASAEAAQTVNVTVTGGDALNITDYTFTSGAVTFASNITANQVVSFPLSGNDSLYEGDETIELTISSVLGGATLSAANVHTHTITDSNSVPVVQWIGPIATFSEAAVSGTDLTVSISGAADVQSVYNYVVAANSATTPSDFTLANGTVTFAANSGTSQIISFSLTDDLVYEGPENFLVSLSPLSGPSTIGANSIVSVTLTDDETNPSVQFQLAAATTGEDASGTPTIATINVSITGAHKIDQTVNYSMNLGTASAGDFTVSSGSLTFPAGTTAMRPIAVSLSNDLLFEGPETFTVTLSGLVGGANLGAQSVHTHTIGDNESPPEISWQLSTSTITEDNTSQNLVISMSAVAAQAQTVNYSISGGTATEGAGNDYVLSMGTATIASLANTVTISANVLEDSIYEGNETALIGLSGIVGGALLGTQSVHTLSIVDDESLPTLTFSIATSNATEANAGFNDIPITVTPSGLSAAPMSIDYVVTGAGSATAGSDFTAVSGTLVFPASSLGAQTFLLPIAGDTKYELDQTVQVALVNPVGAGFGAITTHTHTIIDNDTAPSFGFQFAVGSYLLENGGTSGVYVTITAASEIPQTVPYTISGTATGGGDDHNLVDGALTFPQNDGTPKGIFITVDTDTIYEGNESITIALGTPVGGGSLGSPSTFSTGITDDETLPEVRFVQASSPVTEGTTLHDVAVSLSGEVQGVVTVNYFRSGTATEGVGNDYLDTASGQITFPSNSTAIRLIPLQIFNDDATPVYEGNEQVVLTIVSSNIPTVGSVSVHTVTIVEDEQEPRVRFIATSGSTAEDEPGGIRNISVSITEVSAFPVTADFQVNGSSTAFMGSDFVLVPASPGTISFPAFSGANNTIALSISNDDLYEPSETVNIELLNITNGLLGSVSIHAHTITDNESVPEVQFAVSNSTVSETQGAPHFLIISLSQAAQADQTVSYSVGAGSATSSSDYTFSSTGTFVVSGATTVAAYPVNMINDGWYEGTETLSITISNPVGGADLGSLSTHTVTITEDESQPEVVFVSASSNPTEGTSPHYVNVQLTGLAQAAQTVSFSVATNLATAGSDFAFNAAALTFPSNSVANQAVTFSISDDAYFEGAEFVTITLGSLSGSATIGTQSVHAVTIADTDIPDAQFVSGSSSVLEQSAVFSQTVSLSAQNEYATTVYFVDGMGSASMPGDFTFPTSIVIAPFAQTANVGISVVEDSRSTDFVDETAIVRISSANSNGATITAGVNQQHSLTILNDDLLVAPVYPIDGANWNDYINRDDPMMDEFHQTDNWCGDESFFGAKPSDCINGGEYKKVHFPALSSCSDVKIREISNGSQTQYFKWVCRLEFGQVYIYSQGLNEQYGLANLINPAGGAGAGSFWPMRVEIWNGAGTIQLGQSENATWWGNTFRKVNNGEGSISAVPATDYGRIYWTNTVVFGTYFNITENAVSLVTLPGGRFDFSTTANTANASCGAGSPTFNVFACFGNGALLRHFWLEAKINLTPASGTAGGGQAIRFVNVDQSRIHNTHIYGQNNNTAAARPMVEFIDASVNLVSNLTIESGKKGLLLVNDSDRNWFTNLRISRISSNMMAAQHLMIDGTASGSDENRFIGLQISTNDVTSSFMAHGLLVKNSAYNVFSDFRVSNISGNTTAGACVKVENTASNVNGANIFTGGVISNCNGDGFQISTSSVASDNVLSHATIANINGHGIHFENEIGTSGNQRDWRINSVVVANTTGSALRTTGNTGLGNQIRGLSGIAINGGGLGGEFININSVTGGLKFTFFGYVLTDVANTCVGSSAIGDLFVGDNGCAPRRVTDGNLGMTSFKGLLSGDDDDANTVDDSAGRAPFSSINATVPNGEWVSFENSYRLWGREFITNFNSLISTCLTGGTCQIFDFRYNNLSNTQSWIVKINDGATNGGTFSGNPSGSALCGTGGVLTPDLYLNYTGYEFHVAMREIIGDRIGNEDGLCDNSGLGGIEHCVYLPNNGAFQGEVEVMGDGVGDDDLLCETGEKCSLTSGTLDGNGDSYAGQSCTTNATPFGINGVRLFKYPSNTAL